MLQQHQPALTPHFYAHVDACDKWGCHRSQLHSSSSTARNLYPNYGFTFTKNCAVLCCAAQYGLHACSLSDGAGSLKVKHNQCSGDVMLHGAH